MNFTSKPFIDKPAAIPIIENIKLPQVGQPMDNGVINIVNVELYIFILEKIDAMKREEYKIIGTSNKKLTKVYRKPLIVLKL